MLISTGLAGNAGSPGIRMPNISAALEDIHGHSCAVEKLIERLQIIADRLTGSDRPPDGNMKASDGQAAPGRPMLHEMGAKNDALRMRIEAAFSECERIERAL